MSMFILKLYISEGDSSATAEGDTTIHDFHFKFTVKSAEDGSANRYFSDYAPYKYFSCSSATN